MEPVIPVTRTTRSHRGSRASSSALACAVMIAFGITWSAPTPAVQLAGQPAAWRHHDLIVSLRNLPKRYSCDDLWYKFRDILLAMGARRDTKILVYQCGERAGKLARSPKVHLQFSTPELLADSQARRADIKAASQTVRLAPGHPASLQESDCELMRQIKDELLPEITKRTVSFNLACPAQASSRSAFHITVQTAIPLTGTPRTGTEAGPLPKRVR
jgi:hypothetical protein